MHRMYWIFVAVTVVVTVVWWSAPRFVASDTGYTALGTLFSALAFAGLIATLYAQREAIDAGNRAHQQSMNNLLEANLVSSAGGLVTAMATALEHVDAELLDARDQRRKLETDARGGVEARMAEMDDLLNNSSIDPKLRDLDFVQILRSTIDQGQEVSALRIDLLDKESEMFSIKLTLLQQLLVASTAIAQMYEHQVKQMPTDVLSKQAELLKAFQQIYGSDFTPPTAA
jgi:hypothetical protein